MIGRYRVLSDRVGHELALLGEVVQRCEGAMERAGQNPADRDFYVAAAALNLHDFYSGLERLFERIASEIDGAVPESGSWHRELLTQMTIPVTDVRPIVLTREAALYLDEYLRLRPWCVAFTPSIWTQNEWARWSRTCDQPMSECARN